MLTSLIPGGRRVISVQETTYKHCQCSPNQRHLLRAGCAEHPGAG